MRKVIKYIDDTIVRHIVRWIYPQYVRPRYGYYPNYKILTKFFFFQKILRVNGSVPWPVDFRSKIVDWKMIKKGICCDPGDGIGQYINASGGIEFGNNVGIGPGTSITSTNHNKYHSMKLGYKKGVKIGDNVWIGANCCIVAGVEIGDNVTIGAGCVIRENIPSNTIVIQSTDSINIRPKTKPYEWNCLEEELNRPIKKKVCI